MKSIQSFRTQHLRQAIDMPEDDGVIRILVLIEAIRRLALQGTELARAYVGTIRLKLFKIGAVILKNTRRVRFLLASGCPYKALFFTAAARLAPG